MSMASGLRLRLRSYPGSDGACEAT